MFLAPNFFGGRAPRIFGVKVLVYDFLLVVSFAVSRTVYEKFDVKQV